MTRVQHTPRKGAASTLEFLDGWADRTFVVSLRRAMDRRERVRERLAGLRFEFLDAVDKLDLDRERLARDGIYDERRTRGAYRHRADMSLGSIGCALSHRHLYEQMLANDWKRMVVFEDDVVPRVPELATLPDVLQELPATWELCYLGYWQNEAVTVGRRLRQAAYVGLAPLRLSRWRTGEALRLLPRSFSPHLRRAGRHMCTHAYAVSREGARKLAAAQTPIALAADQLLTMLVLQGRLEAYAAAPVLFDQESLEHSVAHVPLVGSEVGD
ncbi:MAG TPA: glycosyltransferase family 25 protein [Anaeromyxobacter sp.]